MAAPRAEAREPMHALRAASRLLLVAGGLMMVAATVLIVVEIVMRQVFRQSLGGVDELAGFALAISTAWSFGAVLLDKAHVRIDTLYLRFGRRGRAALDILGLGGTVVFIGAVVFFGAQVLQASLRFGATSQSSLAIPKALPQALWLGGLAWFLFVAAVLLIASVMAALRGDWKRIGQLAGAQQIEDELAAELAQVERRGLYGTEGARP